MPFLNSNDEKRKGKLLSHGQGIDSFLNTAYKNNYKDYNTAVYVDNPNDVNSKWKIYDLKRKKE